MIPKLTIAVLTYNRATYLKEMLTSIQRQTYSDFIVEIYDNGSVDNTSEIVSSFLHDSRFHYIRHKQNIGAVKNMNYVLENCKTEFLSLTHDDDSMLPTFIQEEFSVIENDHKINLVCTDCNFIDANTEILREKIISSQCKLYSNLRISQQQFLTNYIENKNYIICPTVMLRMDVVRKNNIRFRDNVGKSCDTFFWIELNNYSGDFYYINTPLYNYRQHENQDSKNWFYMMPMLRVPVYKYLKQHGYPRKLTKKWIQFHGANISAETILQSCNDLDYIKNVLLLPFPLDSKKNIIIFLFFKFHFFYQLLYKIPKGIISKIFRKKVIIDK